MSLNYVYAVEYIVKEVSQKDGENKTIFLGNILYLASSNEMAEEFVKYYVNSQKIDKGSYIRITRHQVDKNFEDEETPLGKVYVNK